MLVCPFCGSDNFRTIDTRNLEKYTGWFRRKECMECHQRWNTFEVLEDELKNARPDDPIKTYRNESVQLAKDFKYDSSVIAAIKKAKTEDEIDRILMRARRKRKI